VLREKGLDPVLRPADDRPAASHEHRPLHQARLRQQELDHGAGRRVVISRQPELLERGVLADEVADRVLEPADDLLEGGPVGLLLQVLDDVELDAQLLRDLYGSLGRVSIRVVEDRDRCDARDRTRRSG